MVTKTLERDKSEPYDDAANSQQVLTELVNASSDSVSREVKRRKVTAPKDEASAPAKQVASVKPVNEATAPPKTEASTPELSDAPVAPSSDSLESESDAAVVDQFDDLGLEVIVESSENLLPRLGIKKTRALMALVSQPTYSAAAIAAGISRATLYRYLKDRDFLEARDALYREAADIGFKELGPAVLVSMRRLRKLVGDKNPNVALAAAKSILQLHYKHFEADENKRQMDQLKLAIQLKG